MTVRSINEAIYRLGRVSADEALTNTALLRRLADIAVETLAVDIALLSVFESGPENPPVQTCIRGPWTKDERDSFLQQIGWRLDERALAQRLAALRPGRLCHRQEFMLADAEHRAAGRNGRPIPVPNADQAAALYRRADGATLLFSIHKIDAAAPIQRITLARAGALAPFIARCWAGSWRCEPGWLASLKPQGRAILDHLLEGYDDDQIAQRTGLSYHSVRAHLKRLFREAGVRSRLHLMQACRCPRSDGADLTVEFPEEDLAQQATG
jgi:DNA-binding CsgD family transcriptional regulator